MPEKYGRSCVLPVKSRHFAVIWPVSSPPDKREVGGSSPPRPILIKKTPTVIYDRGGFFFSMLCQSVVTMVVTNEGEKKGSNPALKCSQLVLECLRVVLCPILHHF